MFSLEIILQLAPLLVVGGIILHGVFRIFSFLHTATTIQNELSLLRKGDGSHDSPPIIILAPMLGEKENAVKFLDSIAKLHYPEERYKVFIITTQKEYIFNRNHRGKTTVELVKEYFKNANFSNFHHIHYPSLKGRKAEQLNYALRILKKRLLAENFDRTLFAVFDADSYIAPDTLQIVASYSKKNSSTMVYQQPHLWLLNYFDLPRNLNGYLMRSFGLLHSFYSLAYEFPMLRRDYKIAYPSMKYCMGHGLFVRGKVLKIVSGFPPLIEDTRLGHICSFLKLEIGAAPIFGLVETAKTFFDFVKQSSVWFFGEMLVFHDFFYAKNINKNIHLPSSIWLIFSKFLKNLGWMNEGIVFLLGFLLVILAKNWFLLLFLLIAVSIKVWIPIILLEKKVNNLLKLAEIEQIRWKLSELIVIFVTAPMLFLFSFLGPYMGMAKFLYFLFSTKEPSLPKTRR